MGFFEDLKKILLNSRLGLISTRTNTDPYKLLMAGNDLSIIVTPIEIKNIAGEISHVSVDDKERSKLMKNIEKRKNSIFIPFRPYETYEYPEFGDIKIIVRNLKTASKL